MSEKAVIGWLAVYAGGSVYTSEDGPWETLPEDGILGVVLCENTRTEAGAYTRQILSGNDHYFHVPPDVWGSSDDPADEIRRRYPGAWVKRGKWVSAAEFARAQEWLAGERFTWLGGSEPKPCEGCG